MSEEKQQNGLLALGEKVLLTKEQAIATGITTLASGVLDVATHGNSLALFASAAGLFLAYQHGNDVFDHFAPGRHGNQAIAATAHFVDAVAAQHAEGEDNLLDQSVPAKLKRLIGMKTPPLPAPKEADQSCVTDKAEPLLVTQGDEPMEALQPKVVPLTSMLPQRSPTFAQMRHLIAPERDILGFDGKHFISGIPFVQSVNIALIGLPRSGKTSCLRFHVAQAIMRGAIIRGWDLHGDVSSEMGAYFTILDQPEEMIADCQWIQNERDRRNALYKRVKKGDNAAIRQWGETREILYVVDEFVALMVRLKQRKEDRDLVADTLLSLIAEGAKLKMRVIIAGQTMPAALFGDGGSSARDIMSVKYAFQSGDRQASMLGIEFDAIKNLLHLISGEDCAGYAILDGGPLVHAILVSIPQVTSSDIRGLIEEYGGDEEDELMDYMISPTTPREEYEERYTEALPVAQRQHVHMSGYNQHRQRLASRKVPVYVAAREQVVQAARMPVRETQEDQDDRMVLDAYNAGKKSGGAINAATRIPLNRINVSLHRLASDGKIDWQARK